MSVTTVVAKFPAVARLVAFSTNVPADTALTGSPLRTTTWGDLPGSFRDRWQRNQPWHLPTVQMHPSHFGHWRTFRIRRVCLVSDTCLILWSHDVKLCCIWDWWQSLLCTTDTKHLDTCFAACINAVTPCILHMNFSVDVSMFSEWEGPCHW